MYHPQFNRVYHTSVSVSVSGVPQFQFGVYHTSVTGVLSPTPQFNPHLSFRCTLSFGCTLTHTSVPPTPQFQVYSQFRVYHTSISGQKKGSSVVNTCYILHVSLLFITRVPTCTLPIAKHFVYVFISMLSDWSLTAWVTHISHHTVRSCTPFTKLCLNNRALKIASPFMSYLVQVALYLYAHACDTWVVLVVATVILYRTTRNRQSIFCVHTFDVIVLL